MTIDLPFDFSVLDGGPSGALSEARSGASPGASSKPQQSKPLYRQIYERFSSAIASGALKPGARIPSARELAAELGLARGTVEAALSLLATEGYLQARGQRGTFVTAQLKPRAPAPEASPPVVVEPAANNLNPWPGVLMPFQMGVPALDVFPRKVWSRMSARCARVSVSADMAYPPPQGLDSLRQEIVNYLQLSRGVACSPAQVFITSGYCHSLELITRALLKRGDEVWVEDPGYPLTRMYLDHARLRPVPVPVDDEGLDVEAGQEAADGARAVMVTPAHQSPLCVSLSLQRRLSLLDWAERQRAWIIEDDYDGEYRYEGRPVPSLQSLDAAGSVLYVGDRKSVV